MQKVEHIFKQSVRENFNSRNIEHLSAPSSSAPSSSAPSASAPSMSAPSMSAPVVVAPVVPVVAAPAIISPSISIPLDVNGMPFCPTDGTKTFTNCSCPDGYMINIQTVGLTNKYWCAAPQIG
jgi:hypothetical protein